MKTNRSALVIVKSPFRGAFTFTGLNLERCALPGPAQNAKGLAWDAWVRKYGPVIAAVALILFAIVYVIFMR